MDSGGVVMAVWKVSKLKECYYNNQHATIIAEYVQPRFPDEEPQYGTVAIKLDDGTVFYYINPKDLEFIH